MLGPCDRAVAAEQHQPADDDRGAPRPQPRNGRALPPRPGEEDGARRNVADTGHQERRDRLDRVPDPEVGRAPQHVDRREREDHLQAQSGCARDRGQTEVRHRAIMPGRAPYPGWSYLVRVTGRRILALLLLAAVLAAAAPCAAARPICVAELDACCAGGREQAPNRPASGEQPRGERACCAGGREQAPEPPASGEQPGGGSCATCECCAPQRVTTPAPPPPVSEFAATSGIESRPPRISRPQVVRDIFRPPRLPLA